MDDGATRCGGSSIDPESDGERWIVCLNGCEAFRLEVAGARAEIDRLSDSSNRQLCQRSWKTVEEVDTVIIPGADRVEGKMSNQRSIVVDLTSRASRASSDQEMINSTKVRKRA